MHFIDLLPLFKLIAAFAAMLAGMRLKLGLGNSILAGALLMGIMFGMPYAQWPEAVIVALTNEKTIYLAAIVGLIMVLSGLLEQTGQSKRLMEAVSAYLRNPTLRLVFFPSLIGLLPMPGGAVFSAPMVEAVSERMALKRKDKVMLNYWFRHIWELGWPLYPGIILSASLADMPLHRLIMFTFPAIPVMLILGKIFVLNKVDIPQEPADADRGERNLGRTIRLGLPLIIAIAGAVALEMGIGFMELDIPFESGVVAALAAAIVCTAAQNSVHPAQAGRLLIRKHTTSMLYVVVSIFIFKEFLQAAGVVDALSVMAGGGVALIAASVFLPFLVGLISGINIAFVGATFPLMFALLDTLGQNHLLLPYLVLGQFAGFTGVMISPIHICFILTCQYFRTEISTTWRRLALPCLGFMLVGYAYFLILKAFFEQ